MTPTKEQQAAIDLFKTGGSLAIEAGAGTGKTSTLVMLAHEAEGRRGQYVAFNKSLVEESKPKFGMSVACNTAHSLAFRAVGNKYGDRLRRAVRMTGWDTADHLNLRNGIAVTTFDGKPKNLTPGYLAGLVTKTVTSFCQSDDRTIEEYHAPWIKGLEAESIFEVKEALVPYARAMWADLQNTFGWVPYKHDHYLKAWQLADPRIYSDFILFDESQDANPVIAAIIAAQAKHAQLVYVGDSQQEIYAFTGAINALAQVRTDHRTFLTQSFRFGQRIADRANRVLEALDAPLRLTGNPAIDSHLSPVETPRAILTRTNAVGIDYLLHLQLAGRRAYFMGGAGEMLRFATSAQELIETGRTQHPDLVCFDSWAAVQDYVQMDEGGEDLRLLVKLVDTFGSQSIVNALDRMPNEANADVVISTAHKAKGREWNSVKLASDFPHGAESNAADLRLLYVALTRAKLTLDDTNLSDPVRTEEED